MKRILFLTVLTLIAMSLGSKAANATLLFLDDFEGDLSAWTGKYMEPHSGEIVADPLDPTNNVLHFTELNSRGDIFTLETFTSKIDIFRLTFDYLGDLDQGGDAGDLGGFVGFTIAPPGIGTESNGTMTWLAGTQDNYPFPRMELPDTNQWVHVQIFFESVDPVALVLEDFLRSNGGNAIAGDVYFDNIELDNPHPPVDEDAPAPVPEPGTLLLMGSGLLGMARRIGKRGKKK